MEQKETVFKGEYYYGLGRRKEATAKVRLYKGKGKVIVNGKELSEYFTSGLLREKIFSPLKLIGSENKFDISVLVSGGGKSGQVGAITHGITRAVISYDESFRTALKKSGFVTRDPRAKERKKYGLKRARKAPQFSKR